MVSIGTEIKREVAAPLLQKSSVSFDLDHLESPNWCQNLGFFILFLLSNMRLTCNVRNIRKTRAERQT